MTDKPMQPGWHSDHCAYMLEEGPCNCIYGGRSTKEVFGKQEAKK